ncbi:hypothetical protein [Flavobacterium psychrophilum]|uniref:hypothetical protein n=1 Tax=Flavobacterium psychrophilum TaxID=96345 RepID=UPI001ABBF347|nr:hypothetical protein [Flavobacterium psychrophilum]
MGFLVIALIIGILPAFIAHNKGRSFFGWWFYGICLFIVALPHSILISSRENLKDKKKCIQCAEYIKKDAQICRYCGYGTNAIVKNLAEEEKNNPFAEWKKNNPNGTLNEFYKNR